jgi:isoamylase
MIAELDERGQKIVGDTLLSLFNAHHEMIPFTLPPLADDQQWQLLLDTTSAANDNLFLAGGASYPLQGRSVAVLRHHRPGEP